MLVTDISKSKEKNFRRLGYELEKIFSDNVDKLFLIPIINRIGYKPRYICGRFIILERS